MTLWPARCLLFLVWLTALVWSPRLCRASQPGERPVWVFLSYKTDGEGGLIEWRSTGFRPSAEQLGLPVDEEAVGTLQSGGFEVRFRSRWLNAVSGVGSPAVLRWVRRQPFVYQVLPVRRLRRPNPTLEEMETPPEAARRTQEAEEGLALDQLAQVRVVELHRQGLDGHGVRVALIDNGFQYDRHPALAAVHVAAARDFVNDDDTVTDQVDQPVTGDETRSAQNVHGAQVLSILAGRDPGRFMGVAPGVDCLLAKTEDNGSEMPVEEDRWVAGLEWADSLGAQIVSSSLGYNRWDDGTGYQYADLDGATAVTSRAAAAAVQRGMVVVVAAGNEGNTDWHYVTTPADADGVIAVGSVDVPAVGSRPPALAPSSSRGPTADGRIKPDVVAPGRNVVAADVRGGGYVRVNGTSYATPMVAGVCALLLQVHPTWGPVEVLAALRSTAVDLGAPGPDDEYGWGQIDALAASRFGEASPPSGMVESPYPNPVTGDVVCFPLSLTAPQRVRLSVFSTGGDLVFSRRWWLGAGDYLDPIRACTWNLKESDLSHSDRLGNGIYYYRIAGESFHRQGTIALMRRPGAGK